MNTTPKKQTVKTAEKRVIKTEISTLTRARRKLASDFRKERKTLASTLRKIAIRHRQLDKSETTETASIDRRIAILRARL